MSVEQAAPQPGESVPGAQTLDGAGDDRSGGLFTRFKYIPHPHIAARKREGPVKVADQLPRQSAIARINSRLALLITVGVGSMWCAYLFIILAFVSFPAAVRSHDTIIIVAWISQTLFQLVLLPVIIVGQNIQGEAADRRSEQTYKDAEAVLHEAMQIQQHLLEQDKDLQMQQQCLNHIIATLRDAFPTVAAELPPAGAS